MTTLVWVSSLHHWTPLGNQPADCSGWRCYIVVLVSLGWAMGSTSLQPILKLLQSSLGPVLLESIQPASCFSATFFWASSQELTLIVMSTSNKFTVIVAEEWRRLTITNLILQSKKQCRVTCVLVHTPLCTKELSHWWLLGHLGCTLIHFDFVRFTVVFHCCFFWVKKGLIS